MKPVIKTGIRRDENVFVAKKFVMTGTCRDANGKIERPVTFRKIIIIKLSEKLSSKTTLI